MTSEELNEQPDATPDNFAKIYGTILDSSIWEEPHHTVRVWITMLVMADKEGIVRASYSGLRRRAGVNMEELAQALSTLEGPDPDSRDGTDGIRVRKIKGGWFVINAKEYRDLRTKDQVAAAERAKRYREKHRNVTDVTNHGGGVTDNARHSDIRAEVEVEGDVEELPPPRARAGETTGEGLVPHAYTADYRKLFILWPIDGLEALRHEVLALLDGMHGYKVSGEIMGRAIRDYVAAFPKQPSLKHFRAFVRSVEREEVRADGIPDHLSKKQGNTLRAGEIINEVKRCRNPQFPGNASAEWRDKLTQAEVRAVNAIGVARILGEDKPGIVLAQLAKMLREAQ